MKRLLLVEDTLELAKVISREFEKAGYEVFHASDGLTALELHASKKPDAIILDWMLPDIDGLEVINRLRQNSATPVLMLTARDEVIDRVVGLEVGADDYLTKPFSMNELVSRVRALLRRSEIIQQMMQADREEPLAIINHGLLMLDPLKHLVTMDGDPIELSRTEFNLLHLLLRNPARTFSREYLLDTVWGETYFGGDRTVDNVISRLRKKLGEIGEVIETVWGVGYRWRQN
jgi:DNA-binding response OmpR family regulator